MIIVCVEFSWLEVENRVKVFSYLNFEEALDYAWDRCSDSMKDESREVFRQVEAKASHHILEGTDIDSWLTVKFYCGKEITFSFRELS